LVRRRWVGVLHVRAVGEPTGAHVHVIKRKAVVVILLQAVLIHQVVIVRMLEAEVGHAPLHVGRVAGEEVVAAFVGEHEVG